MKYVQVKKPNLNVPAVLGWCLAYVQDAFGSGWAGDYALDGWNRNQHNHADRNIPAGVYVPIWFDGYWTGIRYGHVAIYKDGTVYSSPWSAVSAANKVHDTLGSIAEVERIYRMSYIGWSEDIGGTRVLSPVKEEDPMKADDVGDLFHIMRGQEPTEAELKQWVGKPMKELKDVLRAQPSWADQIKNQQVGKSARKGGWEKQLKALNKLVADLQKGKESAKFEELKQTVYVKKA